MRLLPALLALVLSLPLAAQAQGGLGDLLIMPTRVILEGRDRSAEVVLRNTGSKPCTYRIFFQEMRMDNAGQVEVVEKKPGALFASDLVRFTPRQVALAPNESQTVRIQLRLPEGLKDGEYRSHMVFQSLPPVEPPAPLGEDADKALSFNIQTVLSISIPVIVRHGETSASVGLSHLAYHPAAKKGEPPVLDLQLDHKGNRSVQGELKVDWLPVSGKAQTVLPEGGAVLYSEVEYVAEHLALSEAKDTLLKGGRLKVTFTYHDNSQQPVVAFLDVP